MKTLVSLSLAATTINRTRLVSSVIVATLLLAAIAMAGINLAGASADQGPQLRIFTVVAISDAGTDGAGVHHRMGLRGDGTFTANQVNASGSFIHFDQATPGVPKTLLASGTWRARKVLSYVTGFGSYGGIDAGILIMEVDLFPDGGPKTKAELTIVCNIGPAGIMTGFPEGYFLDIPSLGLTFEPILVPVVPAGVLPIGLTHIGVPGSKK